MKEKVSVVMCTYNGERYIREQLDSVLRQTYPIHELLIKDDCSTDGTTDIIKREYTAQYPFIRLIENEEQTGINRNFFSAMNLSTGKYIAIADQDDIWEPDKIENQMNAIEGKLLCTGFSKPFSSEGTDVSFDSRIPNHSIIRMMYVGMIPGHTMLIHRDILKLLPESAPLTYDHQLQIAAANSNGIVFINKVLVNQRRHPAAATFYTPVDRRWNIGNICNKIRETISFYKELKPAMQQRFGVIEDFLKSIPNPNEEMKSAICMAHLQTQNTFISWLKLTLLCIRLRDRLFHTREKKSFVTLLRAAYFPISCSSYFRYMSKRSKQY